jgi:broad specificity phosphatase PhoE
MKTVLLVFNFKCGRKCVVVTLLSMPGWCRAPMLARYPARMPATLLLIRHGQTPNNLAKLFRGPEGASDGLDETGHAQAKALGQALAARQFARPRLYASTYLRAQQTGGHIADALGVPLHVLPGVHEIHTGSWMGRPYSDMNTHLHELLAPDGQFGYPGGESLAGVGERFHQALLGLNPQDGETVLVVSHGAALVAVLARLFGKDSRAAWLSDEYRHDNSAVTELVWNTELIWNEGGQPEMVRLADVSHLAQKV